MLVIGIKNEAIFEKIGVHLGEIILIFRCIRPWKGIQQKKISKRMNELF